MLGSELCNDGFLKLGAVRDSFWISLVRLTNWFLSVYVVSTTFSAGNRMIFYWSIFQGCLVLDLGVYVIRSRFAPPRQRPRWDSFALLYSCLLTLKGSGFLINWCARFSPVQNLLVRAGMTKVARRLSLQTGLGSPCFLDLARDISCLKHCWRHMLLIDAPAI